MNCRIYLKEVMEKKMNLTINEIIGTSASQKFMDSFCDTAGIGCAILDLKGNIILGSRWQKLCTDFHRKNELSCEKCIESDTILANRLQEGERFSLYNCKNGLVDAASPIIVQGKHIANAFVGQFLIHPPDINAFRHQAKTYGFDETAYLEALSDIPIIEEQRVPTILNFLVNYAELMAEVLLKHQLQLESEKQLIHAKQDLSQREKQEKELEFDRKRLLSILDGIEDVIYVADPKSYELLHVNKAFTDDWGTEVIGKKCYKVIQDRDDPCPFCTNHLIFGEYLGRSYVWEFQNQANKNWYRCSDKAIEWVDGRMVRFEIAADISQLKFLEEELQNKNKDLLNSNKELEQFAYVASHDLQEPLRMVASYTELLQERYEGKLDEKADKYIRYAVEGAKRMQLLINDLLVLSRVNTKGKPFEPVECNELLKRVLHGLGTVIHEKQAQVQVTTLPTVLGDEGQLFQLFQNIISNAIKFHGADRPLVEISAVQKHSDWVFSIRDNGIGIDPEYFERIFVIFQRLHERGAYDGSGIGLAISKKIVERHGGKIWVKSEPGKGTVFYFSLQETNYL